MIEEPITEYVERRFWKRRRFKLFPGRLCIEGRHGGGTFVLNFPLDNVSLPCSSVAIRDGVSQILAALPFILMLFTTGLWGITVCAKSQSLFFCILIIVFVGMICVPFLVRRTPYVQYFTTAGIAVFSIGQLGNTEEQWKTFVSCVEKEIAKMAKANSVPSNAGGPQRT